MVSYRERIQEQLASEQGCIKGVGARSIALVYPSPYSVGMSSLGFQTVYRLLNDLPDTVAERAFLPDGDVGEVPHLVTYESGRPVSDFPVVAFSVAYELELTGLFRCLELMGVAPERRMRSEHAPLIIAGGPLTFSNPVPLVPFVDVIVLGEAEDLLAPLMEIIFAGATKGEVLKQLRDVPGLSVPEHHGEYLGTVAQCDSTQLPAHSVITTPLAVLSEMFLVENERGCSRACSFCVMRRSTNGGMRVIAPDRVIATIPEQAKRVGLVGAAVSDHPKLLDIVRAVVEGGREIGLSSLRADRLSPELVELLIRGGYRTLTVASDGASEVLRRGMLKKIRAKHLRRAAELAHEYKVPQLKVYMMVGVPGEGEEDIDELISFSLKQADICKGRTRLSLGVAPFVAKRNTPLDGAAFAGIREVDRVIKKLRRALRPKVELRATSSRWAWAEYQLAQGSAQAGLAAYRAHQQGGRFSDWKKAFKNLAPMHKSNPKLLPLVP